MRLAAAEGGVKICFVIPSLAGGGAERVAVTVLSALDGARHERVLYLFSGADGVYFDRVAPGIRVVIAERRSWVGRLCELASFLRVVPARHRDAVPQLLHHRDRRPPGRCARRASSSTRARRPPGFSTIPTSRGSSRGAAACSRR